MDELKLIYNVPHLIALLDAIVDYVIGLVKPGFWTQLKKTPNHIVYRPLQNALKTRTLDWSV
jgi:hypothetical protein